MEPIEKKNGEETQNETWKKKEFRKLVYTCLPHRLNQEGIQCTWYTWLVRLKSLERAYLKDPDLVKKYIDVCKPFLVLSQGGFLIRPDMGGTVVLYLDEHFFAKLGLKEYRDYFFVDGWYYHREYTTLSSKATPEELEEKARNLWENDLLSIFFDYTEFEEGYIVIKLKPGMNQILDDEVKYKKLIDYYLLERAEDALEWQRTKERQQWEEFWKKKIYSRDSNIGGWVADADFKGLTVCATCGLLYGRVRRHNHIYYQVCRCHKYNPPPHGYTSQEYSLCYFCGLDIIHYPQKIPADHPPKLYACANCREYLKDFERLSKLMSVSAECEFDERIRFYIKTGNKFYDILRGWLKIVVKRNLSLLGFLEDIPLEYYLFLLQEIIKVPPLPNFRDAIVFYFRFLAAKTNDSFLPILI